MRPNIQARFPCGEDTTLCGCMWGIYKCIHACMRVCLVCIGKIKKPIGPFYQAWMSRIIDIDARMNSKTEVAVPSVPEQRQWRQPRDVN